MRRSWILGLFALCALLAPLAPLTAADSYVPLAANVALGGATYRTLLIATNTGATPFGFSVTFLPSGTDGTAGSPQPATFTLPAGVTLRLYNAIPQGARGMLALSGAAEIVVSARVEALAANGGVLASAQVPVIGAADSFSAGQQAQLQGLESSASGATTDFGLMNLSGNAAHCTVESFRAGGARIAAPVSLLVPALSNNDFRGALTSLGAASIRDARFAVTCDQTFGTYALVYRPGGPETVVLTPAPSLSGDLTPPPVDAGGVSFNLPGQFANGSTAASFDLPLQAGTQYGQAHIEFDVLLDHWHPAIPLNPMFHNVASFRRSAGARRDRVLYWGLILKGSGDFRTILDMGIPPGANDGTIIHSGAGPWRPHNTYHLVFDYDAAAGTIVFEAFQNGTRVQRLSGPLNNADISNQPGKTVSVDFSSPGIGDGAYFPTLGWTYSNLAVRLIPRSH